MAIDLLFLAGLAIALVGAAIGYFIVRRTQRRMDKPKMNSASS